MSSGPAYDLHKINLEGVSKFDYFICGVSGALIGYISQHFTPHKLAFDAHLLELLSLLTLTLGFVAGLKRIEFLNVLTSLNFQGTVAADRRKSTTSYIRELERKPQRGAVDEVTGESISIEELRRKLLDAIPKEDEARRKFDQTEQRAKRWYRWRNCLLVLAFGLIISSKILSAY